ncbi:Hypothetical predicted protein [Xyrichtys novacula]|uniref:Uncharacterized protein n=1 Tax=Xyrichtys novacula TaxID=13765 RepID=A0AAV1FDS6_XYRNO|nr:Hypothetical predicted protein [Xyrichtys novacula]
MDRSFLSPPARGQPRVDHLPPRCEAPDGRKPGDALPPQSPLLDAFSPTEMSAPVASTPASVRTGRLCVTGVGGGARLRHFLQREDWVRREALLLPGRGGRGLEKRNILYFRVSVVSHGSKQSFVVSGATLRLTWSL